MLPAEGVLRAAQRWLNLLQRSTVQQASALIKADSAYTDLTTTQYATALDWLAAVGLVDETPNGWLLGTALQGLDEQRLGVVLFERSLAALAPPWLPDADVLLRGPDDLPADALTLADLFGVEDSVALLVVRQVHGRVDQAMRAEVGLAGELALVKLLEGRWPGSVRHVALTDDGFGYDIEFRPDQTYHLEVKSTNRRGRLTVFLSRHEHEVALVDPAWRLVVVGLDTGGRASTIATVRHVSLAERAPRDHDPSARWESVRHQLGPGDLLPGLAFLDRGELADDGLLGRGCLEPGNGTSFAWMPG